VRTMLDNQMKDFERSGNGDGGEPLKEDEVFGLPCANFWNFCHGDMTLYYFYYGMAKHQLLKSTVSSMNKEDTHGSDHDGSSTTDPPSSRPRGKRSKSDEADEDDISTVMFKKSADEMATDAAKRRKMEAQATMAEREASAAIHSEFAVLSAKYTEATEALMQYEQSSTFKEDSFAHKIKKTAIAMLEKSLGPMM